MSASAADGHEGSRANSNGYRRRAALCAGRTAPTHRRLRRHGRSKAARRLFRVCILLHPRSTRMTRPSPAPPAVPISIRAAGRRAAADLLVLRSRWFDKEMLLRFEKGPGYVGHELMVPTPATYYTAVDRKRPRCGGSEAGVSLRSTCAGTGGAAVEGTATRRTSSARCTAGPTASTPAARRAGLRRHARLRVPKRRWQLQGCCLPGRATRPRSRRLSARRDYTSPATCSRKGDRRRAAFTGRTSSRSSSSCTRRGGASGVQNGRCPQLRVGFAPLDYQIMGVKEETAQPDLANYTRYRDAVLATPAHAAEVRHVWSILYPNVMIEWYPCALVVSTLIPARRAHTNIVESITRGSAGLRAADRRCAPGGVCGVGGRGCRTPARDCSAAPGAVAGR